MTYEAIYAPVSGFLVYLADGWTLPFVVEPMHGHHGTYSILLVKTGNDNNPQ